MKIEQHKKNESRYIIRFTMGDEGKGKIVDFIGKKYNLIGRFRRTECWPYYQI